MVISLLLLVIGGSVLAYWKLHVVQARGDSVTKVGEEFLRENWRPVVEYMTVLFISAALVFGLVFLLRKLWQFLLSILTRLGLL